MKKIKKTKRAFSLLEVCLVMMLVSFCAVFFIKPSTQLCCYLKTQTLKNFIDATHVKAITSRSPQWMDLKVIDNGLLAETEFKKITIKNIKNFYIDNQPLKYVHLEYYPDGAVCLKNIKIVFDTQCSEVKIECPAT